MASARTATRSFRIEPRLKVALRVVAGQEHRSIANMIEVMIGDDCGRVEIEIEAPDAQPPKIKRGPKKK